MIYCVEDDQSIRDLIIYTLKYAGFEAIGFSDGKSLFEALASELPELILLDIMLPETDGIDILKTIRQHPDYQHLPIIMATAKTTEYDKVIGLDSGADDYLSKPFGMMEMVSRIKAVLRRAKPTTDSPSLHYANISLDRASHTVRVDGEEVMLTLKEYNLLKLFMSHPSQVFTREQLLEKVWDLNYMGETRTVDVHIGTLRSKLKSAGHYIMTVRGIGYKLEKL